MDLSKTLIRDFVKEINTPPKQKNDNTQLQGTIAIVDNNIFVELDGSQGNLTPVSKTAGVSDGDRVLVTIKNRKASIIGNYSDPSASDSVVTAMNERVTVAENNLDDIETDISILDGRVRSAEGDISQVERAIGDPSDESSATGSLYARVNNVKDIGDRAITEIESEVTRAKAAEQEVEIAADNAQSAANQAISNAANALSAANVAQSAAEAASIDAADAGRAASLAQSAAEAAQTAATQAIEDASTAQAAAERAEGKADNAAEAADKAEEKAEQAEASATSATIAANSALSELGVVESVTDTLNWFVDHKKLTPDTTVVQNKNYYIYNPTTGTLTKATPVGTENPHALGWFELNEAISEYVASHVALTNDGLYVVNVSGGWKVLISNGAGSFTAGIFILSPSGEIMQASTANGISFSENKPFYIGDDDAAIVFDGNGHISIAGTGITIGSKTLSSVLDELGSSLKSIEYGKGSSPTSHSDITNWNTTTPVWEEGKYIWMRTTTNGLTYTYTCIQGAKGATGDRGESGDSAISISINSENGLIFKNTISTSLTAVVNVGLTKISNMNDLREYFGDDATIIWYKNDVYYDTGFTLMNVTGNTKMDFRCELMA